MTRWSIFGSMVAGAIVLLAMHLLYVLVLLDAQRYELLRLMLLAFPALAAFLVAYLAPHRKFVSAMFLSLFGATLGVISMPIYKFAGLYVDSIGGLFDTFVIFFFYHAFMSALGGLGGIVVSRMKVSRA